MKSLNTTRCFCITGMMFMVLSNPTFGQGWTDDGAIVRLTTSSDNVGIGTSIPYTKLTLAGSLGFTNNSTPMCYAYQSGTNNTERFIVAHSPAWPTFGLSYADVGDKMHFKSAGTSVMTVDLTWKRVGIGTSTPSSRLHVKDALGNNALVVTDNGQTLVGLDAFSPEYQVAAGLQVYSTISDPNGLENQYAGYFKNGAPITWGGDNYGVYGEGLDFGVCGDGWFGVCGYSSSTGTGVAGYAGEGGTGVQGQAGSDPTNGWAGVFWGDVYANGSYMSSDEKLKRNIQPLDGALDRLMSLAPKTFEYRTDQYEYMSLPRGNRYGFIAQELTEVFPELTKKAIRPVITPEEMRSGKKNAEKIEFATVDYLSLVPIIVAAIQEQQVLIAQMQGEKAGVAAIDVSSNDNADITTLRQLVQAQQKALGQQSELLSSILETLKDHGMELKGAKIPDRKTAEPEKGQETIAPQEPEASLIGEALPEQDYLSVNYPNPFNPTTRIEYALPHEGQVTLKVYNTLGQEIVTLVDEVRPAGYFTVEWDGKNKSGSKVSSGVYYYRFETVAANGQTTFTDLKKMILAK